MTQNAQTQKKQAWLTHQILKLINGHIMTISGHFFASTNYMNIFYKTEIQVVILRDLTSLKLLNWYKSYDTKRKNAKNVNEVFYKIAKKRKWKYLLFES